MGHMAISTLSHLPRVLSGARIFVCAAFFACVALVSGCAPEKEPDRGANQSLVEIGERALEAGEEMESQGRLGEAHLSYRRSLWAFRYHEKLTGEEPILLDEALDGLERTRK